MDSVKVGLYLTELRKYYKITQDDLANHLSVSRQAVSRWETGASLPAIEVLLKLSELYGVTINDILQADISKIKYQKEIVFPGKGEKNKKIFLIGCGRWGSFIAWYLDRIGHNVSLYGRSTSANMQRFMETRKNEYLTLPESINLTTDLEGCQDADVIVISISSQTLRQVATQLSEFGITDKTIVLCMKGIEIESGRRLSQVVTDTVDHSNKVAVWLGPGHVQEFCRGIPNCMVIDSTDELVKDELIRSFSSDLIRFYYGTDLIGNEIGGAAKNVIGIAAGVLDGLDMSSLKGALMARGTREIARLIAAMGGEESSAYGLCHLGDYEATLFSKHSQNRAYGESIVMKTGYKKLAEGYYTVKALCNLGKSYGVELPICEAVYAVLYENIDVKEAFGKLFQRSLKNEF
ncbi:MAG: NAD(P)H-dependent glycerol-3-phosphate dehydrogenase [Tyzzerella sp.]|nr:NAD(P)H-dependent glycerol-3-phosphate dehydrogenase [Tyzzerella sp.]